MIYFIQCGPDGPIKIGWTDGSIVGRTRSLQMASPHVLVIVGAYEGDRNDEASLHRMFSQYRVRGEWFHPNQKIVDHISENGGMASYYNADRPDLRRAVDRSIRKFWPKDLKEQYLRLDRRKMGFWQQSSWHIEPDYQKAVEEILTDPRIAHLAFNPDFLEAVE